MPPTELPAWAWLFFYSLAIGCVIASIWCGVTTRGRAAGWVLVRVCLAALVVPLVAFLAPWVEDWLGDPQRIYGRLAVFAAGVAVAILLLTHEAMLESRHWWRSWGRSALLTAVSLLFALAIGLRFHRSATPPPERGYVDYAIPTAQLLRDDGDVLGVTDLGRSFPLLRFDEEAVLGRQPSADDSANSLTPLLPRAYRKRVILADSTFSPANCHGWIFAAGKYLIPSRYVDWILEDNDYHIVREPKVGDLIVYRDDLAEPVHTGIVKAVGQGGFVLIESKWGALDTFYHLPRDQAYSSSYNYYRSQRKGHEILFLAHSADIE